MTADPAEAPVGEGTDDKPQPADEAKKAMTKPAPAQEAKAAEAVPAKSAMPGREDNLTYDLKHLAAFDLTPLPPSTKLADYSRDTVQLLVNKIFSLPRQKSDVGTVVTLPQDEGFKLPRSKPVPKEKPKTRWQKFMEERNMRKRKRSSLVWDETSGDWKRRWGYKSAKHTEEKHMAIMEVKQGQDSMENPFDKRAAEKKLQQTRQKMREVRNKVEAAGGKLKAAVPDLGLGRHEGRKLAGGLRPGMRGKEGLDEALKNAQISTASFGRFDRVAPNERRTLPRTTPKGGASRSGNQEKDYYLKQAGRVLSSDGTVDKEKAAKMGAKDVAAAERAVPRRNQDGPKRRSKQGGKKKFRRR